ncbi:hypothetical protein GCM10020000_81300 [Streptomyces olivoverticillatus]
MRVYGARFGVCVRRVHGFRRVGVGLLSLRLRNVGFFCVRGFRGLVCLVGIRLARFCGAGFGVCVLSSRRFRGIARFLGTRPRFLRVLRSRRFRGVSVRLLGFRFRSAGLLQSAVGFLSSRRFRGIARLLGARVAPARGFRRFRRACAGVRICRLRRLRGVDRLGRRGLLRRRGLLGLTVTRDPYSDIATSKHLNRCRHGGYPKGTTLVKRQPAQEVGNGEGASPAVVR